jgi:hypothetical protein
MSWCLVGSEMCIRDRHYPNQPDFRSQNDCQADGFSAQVIVERKGARQAKWAPFALR